MSLTKIAKQRRSGIEFIVGMAVPLCVVMQFS